MHAVHESQPQLGILLPGITDMTAFKGWLQVMSATSSTVVNQEHQRSISITLTAIYKHQNCTDDGSHMGVSIPQQHTRPTMPCNTA
jgi:hypothetical protein